MLHPSALFLFAFATVFAAQEAIECKIVTFPVSAIANNEDFGNSFDPENATSINQFVTQSLNNGAAGVVGQISTSIVLSISAQYCAPAGATHPETLPIQLLAHGNTCDRTIWDALSEPNLQASGYSYQRYFASRGYATLAIDLPGHGNSTLPDPNTVVQMPIEAAVINSIAASLRSTNNALGIAFPKVVFTGHSYGSITGVAAARFDPDFVDAMVLTGWSAFVPLPSPMLLLQMQSAALLFNRFQGYPLGYITASNETGHEAIFYSGNYDPAIPKMSFEAQDVMTCGEGGSLVEGLQPASGFSGKILAVTGSDDILFCNPKNGVCADQLTNSSFLFPDAALFQSQVINDTGHHFMLHSSSAKALAIIQQFLESDV
ncbi:alpha beta-hydrolase [Trichoderma arundinaceum]|uniref:Alpha beta-hydrolase n=1 Tax=Trichoderma arundinaceum TaxID=490622 RepID=A0A395P042_TRIAR|nr:alpha beta-hydrolase [Trichoderma arundinaceum]